MRKEWESKTKQGWGNKADREWLWRELNEWETKIEWCGKRENVSYFSSDFYNYLFNSIFLRTNWVTVWNFGPELSTQTARPETWLYAQQQQNTLDLRNKSRHTTRTLMHYTIHPHQKHGVVGLSIFKRKEKTLLITFAISKATFLFYYFYTFLHFGCKFICHLEEAIVAKKKKKLVLSIFIVYSNINKY